MDFLGWVFLRIFTVIGLKRTVCYNPVTFIFHEELELLPAQTPLASPRTPLVPDRAADGHVAPNAAGDVRRDEHAHQGVVKRRQGLPAGECEQGQGSGWRYS